VLENQSRSYVLRAVLIFFLCTIVLALEFALYSVRWIALSALIGIALSVILYPAMRFLKIKLKIPKGVSGFLFFFGSLAMFVGIGALFYSIIADQLVPLAEKFPSLIQQARGRLEELFSSFPGLSRQVSNIDVSSLIGGAPGELARGVKFGASAIGGLVFIAILAVYLSLDAENYMVGLLSLWPARSRSKAHKALSESAVTIRQWFVSQLIAMTAVGLLTALGLWIVGLDYWLLFGVLTGLLDIIPYVGPLLSASGAIVIALASDPEKVIFVVLVYFIVQQIEGHLIIPLVMKERIDLPPAHLMTLMLVLGSWFGIVGLLIAPGLLAVGRTLYQKIIIPSSDRSSDTTR